VFACAPCSNSAGLAAGLVRAVCYPSETHPGLQPRGVVARHAARAGAGHSALAGRVRARHEPGPGRKACGASRWLRLRDAHLTPRTRPGQGKGHVRLRRLPGHRDNRPAECFRPPARLRPLQRPRAEQHERMVDAPHRAAGAQRTAGGAAPKRRRHAKVRCLSCRVCRCDRRRARRAAR